MKLAESFPNADSLPNERELASALEASRLLAPLLKQRSGLSVPLNESDETAEIPPTAVRFLVDILFR